MIKKIRNYFLKRKFREEYQILGLIKTKLGNLNVILEAGGHNGKDTLRMRGLWPDADIHVFEPEPELYTQLKTAASPFPKIHTYQLALSNQSGNVTFHKSSGRSDASGSLLKPKDHLLAHPDVFFDEQFEVTAIKLDEWAAQNNVKAIDFMWLDMQGHELNMLKGSPGILAKTTAVYTEVSLIETYEGVSLYPEYRKFMEQNGFEVFIEYLTWKDMGNVLFLRKEYV